MPYATRTRIRPLPRPRHPRPPRRSISVAPRGTGQTLTQQLGGLPLATQVYLSFDPPSTANPAWLDVTPFIDQTKNIVITPGRTDGLSDVNATTCALTVDNSDGRWTASNPSGAWNGLIRKGAWLRVDVLPLSGVVSRRFTGYITALPNTLQGLYSESAVTASDIMVLETQAPKLASMVTEEWMSDPIGAPHISAYWPLHEPAGATYASDISGNAPLAAQTLAVRSYGVTAGSGLTWAGTPAPGFDQQSTIVFAPSGTPLLAVGGTSNTGARPFGSYLQGSIALAACAHITCWIKTTTARQPIWSWSDPTTNYALGIQLDQNGFLEMWQAPLSGNNPSYAANTQMSPLSTIPLNDGVWHQISVRVQTVAATNFNNNCYFSFVVDGSQFGYALGTSTPAGGFCPAPNMSRFLLGAAEGWNDDAAVTGLAMFTGAISDLVVHLFSDPHINFDWYNPYLASAGGHTGDMTGQRLARLAAYAGLPVPLASFALPGTGGLTALRPTTGISTALNVGATAHACGPQTTNGKNVLDAMREVAHTELMPLFIDAFGRTVLQASTLRQNPTATVTITAVDLDPSTSWADDFQYTVNQMAVTPAGQGQITVNTNGAASQTLNGIRGGTLATVNLNALEAASLGAAVIAAGANPPPRPAPLAVEAATLALQTGYGAAWYDSVLALTISGVIAVTGWVANSPYGAGGSSSHTIEGWTETIGPGNHLFAWATSPAQGPTYQCDSSTLGLIDTPGITLAY